METRRDNGEIACTELSLAAWGSAGWVDVAAAKPSWTSFNVTGYEIKVSRSDFLSDVRSGKFRRYLDFFHRFYFATPAGMMKKDEVPQGMGLIVRSENGWSGVVGPSVMTVEEGALKQMLMAMLFRQKKAPWRTADDTPEARAERVRAYRRHMEATRIIDGKARDEILDGRRALRKIDRAREMVADALDTEPGDRRLTDLVNELVRTEATDHKLKVMVEQVVKYKLRMARRSIASDVERLEAAEDELRGIADMEPRDAAD